MFTTYALTLALAAAPPTSTAPAAQDDNAAAAENPSLRALRTFILDKLAYDHQYFEGILKQQQSGKRDQRLKKEVFAKEVQRAKLNLPVLRTFERERAAHLKGAPLSSPGQADVHRQYTNLIGLLNMMLFTDQGRADDVIARGAKLVIKKKEDLGVVRGGGADYYLALYRAYFYLMASAHWQRGEDPRAVEWMARLEADKDLAALKTSISEEPKAPVDDRTARLEALRTRPTALLPLATADSSSSLSWAAAGLVEVLTADLTRMSDLVVVERARVDQVVSEAALGLAGVVEASVAKDLGKMLSTGSVILGDVSKSGDGARARVSLRLVDADDARILGVGTSEAAADDVVNAGRTALIALLAELGWSDAVVVDALLATPAPSGGTLRTLHEARLLRSAKGDEARALFAKAVREDPAVANLWSDLKGAYGDVAATIAVVDLLGLSPREGDGWMPRAVRETLATDLPKLGFSVVERGRLDAVASEQLARAAADPNAAVAVGASLSADFVATGSVLAQPRSVRVDVRFVDVRSGVIAFSTSVEDEGRDLSRAMRQLSLAIAEHFNQPLSDASIDQLAASKMSNDELERYARSQLAKDRLRAATVQQTSPSSSLSAPLIVAVVGGVAGTAVAATGVIMADGAAGQAHEVHALSRLASAEQRPNFVAERDAFAATATAWNIAAASGAVIAVASVGWLVLDTVLRDDDQTSAPSPSSPSPAPVAVAGAR